MNTATANLENDHIYILRLISVMEQIILKHEIDISHLETIVDLIRNYADGLHHAKEENLLFPKMVEKGYSFQNGPVAVMMNDHVLGRGFVKGIADNISLYKSGNLAASEKIFKNMSDYTELLKAHISKENNVLFRMADHILSAEEQQSLLEQFRKVENNLVSDKSVESYIEHIHVLATIYKI